MKPSLIFPLGSIAIMLSFGIAYGFLSDRWGVSQKVIDAANRLNDVPMEFGDWVGAKGSPIDKDTQRTAGAVNYLTRTYTNANGDTVFVTMLCGRPGPISTHSPDVCFRGAGLRQKFEAEEQQIPCEGSIEANFLSAEFQRPQSKPGPDMKTYWSISPNGTTWYAVSDSRLQFGHHPYLYRTFISTSMTRLADEDQPDVIEEFLKDFLPVTSEALDDREST